MAGKKWRFVDMYGMVIISRQAYPAVVLSK
jgi:hypothetical protein